MYRATYVLDSSSELLIRNHLCQAMLYFEDNPTILVMLFKQKKKLYVSSWIEENCFSEN